MSTKTQSLSAPKSSFWVATLLVSGTCIGGGMLAMPVQTAESGFFISIAGILISWAFMTFTGLLIVEATLWVKNETHFSSLSRILIGNKTRALSTLIYLFMNYASLVAYTAGGAALINHWGAAIFGISLGYEFCCALFTLVFGLFLFVGSHSVAKLNFVLMFFLVAAYIFLVLYGIGHVQAENLAFRPAWRQSIGIFSIILATFSYQMIVPSLCAQMHYDPKPLKWAIIIGTAIPAVVYSLWLFVIHGIVPLEGTASLREALAHGSAATEPLGVRLQSPSLMLVADAFAFFCLVTSYLGLSCALFYFLKDCFSELKVSMGKNGIIFWTVLPALGLAILFPRALLQCLDISGGFGDTLLSGLIPIAMVWMGRYRKGLSSDFLIPGGKAALALAALFYISVFLISCR